MSINHPSVLFISYYFAPSNAVGARRPTATVVSLLEVGYSVEVVRGVETEISFDKQKFECESFQSQKYSPSYISVSISRKRRSRMMRIVRKFQMLTGRTGLLSATASSQVPHSAAVLPQSSERGVLSFARAFEAFLQHRKRWLLVAVWRVTIPALRGRYNLVVASGPPSVSMLCGYWASSFARVPLVLDYRDPWFMFEEHEHLELNPTARHKLIGRAEDALGRRVARRAAAVIVATEGIGRHIVETTGVDKSVIHVVPNGFDELPLDSDIGSEKSLRILYCGSLYWNRSPFEFFAAVGQMVSRAEIDRAKVRVLFVGECRVWNGTELRSWLEERELSDIVEIREPVAPAEVRQLIAWSNLLLNLAQGQGRQIPAKSYEAITSGRPSLVLTERNTDLARLFHKTGVGIVVEPNDRDGIETALIKRYCEVTGDSLPDRVVPIGGVEAYSRRRACELFRTVLTKVLNRD